MANESCRSCALPPPPPTTLPRPCGVGETACEASSSSSNPPPLCTDSSKLASDSSAPPSLTLTNDSAPSVSLAAPPGDGDEKYESCDSADGERECACDGVCERERKRDMADGEREKVGAAREVPDAWLAVRPRPCVAPVGVEWAANDWTEERAGGVIDDEVPLLQLMKDEPPAESSLACPRARAR